MNQQDLEFADYYIDCLLKKHPKAINPSYKKYGNAYNVIKELRFDGIIEREGSNYIISSVYYHDIKDNRGYSNYINSLNESFLQINELNITQKKNLKKILFALSEKTEVSLEYANENLGINNNNVVFIFNYLIDNDLVLNLRTKQGSSIGIKRDIDYFKLSETVVIININEAPSNNPEKKTLFTRMIKSPWIIGLVLIIIAAILNADRISNFINDIINNM